MSVSYCKVNYLFVLKLLVSYSVYRVTANVSGVAVSAGNKSTNCPPTTNVCKKHYRLIKHCTPHCGNPLLPDALLAVEGIVESV